MTNYVMLNNAEHAGLRVATERSKEYGDEVKHVMTFPFEFRNIQAHYPIFFQKDAETGTFFPLALFGFAGNENLFLTDDGWNADYIPLMIRRQPFLIGFQQDAENSAKKNAMVTIDLDNPRVLGLDGDSQDDTPGEALFHDHGGTTDFLQEISQSLELIHQAHEHSDEFIKALVEHDLLESFTLEIELVDGSKNQLLGFYTIREESVQALSGEILGELNERGFLQPIFMVIASHSCIADLVARKNAIA